MTETEVKVKSFKTHYAFNELFVKSPEVRKMLTQKRWEERKQLRMQKNLEEILK
jgi:hypothetical protein